MCEICDNDRRVVSCAAGARRRLCAVTRPDRGGAGPVLRDRVRRRACPGRSGSTSLHPSLGAASATTSATAAAAPIGIAGSERGTIAWRGLVRVSAPAVGLCTTGHTRPFLRRNAPVSGETDRRLVRGWGKQARLISNPTSLCKDNKH